jgi:ribosome-binding ATPase YchF (GTP1/OBG family)
VQGAEKRLEKLQKLAKGSKEAKAAAEHMQQLLAHLNEGKAARDFPLPENEGFLAAWRELGLLTAKPVIYCAGQGARRGLCPHLRPAGGGAAGPGPGGAG